MVGNLQIQHVSRFFPQANGEGVQALEDISLHIKPGSFVSLIGPSGCGKSTLLRMIAGLDQPDEGQVLLDDDVITKPGADRGFMFQEHNLFPWMNIYDNVAFGLRARNLYNEQKDEVDRILELVGLTEFHHSYPHQLSGGMCQRASLARALVGRPKVLLLDEPLGALDAFTRMNIQDEIQRIWKQEHMTMIMVTHDVEEAVYLSDEIEVMSARPGKILKQVQVKLERPRDRSSQSFFRYTSEVLRLLHYGREQAEPEFII